MLILHLLTLYVTSQLIMGNTLVLWQHNAPAKRKVMDAPPKTRIHLPAKTVHHAESPTPSSHSSPEKTAHCAEPPLPASNINLSSDDGPLSPLYLSDTPSQLLEEVQKYTPAELLKEAWVLALQLLKSIPEACPGDLLHI
ncbi:hypothetical protein BS47DRAFT_1367453 [Hydnum rufescens UP504]|uniref:Uncharacterized protein n=1 Tax=Hydnum rufescens UP504 TaxID=1448309 RepID=A0A9P6DQ61_9AGAM|nr:hypothetical protein BS47DRAFT_1367453 [Hydnum rufescens UP504]